MWVNSFPPLDSIVGFVRWLVVVHTGDMLAYPCGGERGGSTVGLIACVVGSVVLWRGRDRAILACLLAPLGLAMLAAALRLYPYGGPAFAPRLVGSDHAVRRAGLALLALRASGSVLPVCSDLIPSRVARGRLLRLGCAGLVAVGVVPLVGSFQRPYRAYHAEAARDFARRFWPEIGRGAEVACLRWDYGVADWDSIHLGIAVSLCNEAIYSPSRKNGGPNWNAVSEEHPLRCVLGRSHPRPMVHEVLAWLQSRVDEAGIRTETT